MRYFFHNCQRNRVYQHELLECEFVDQSYFHNCPRLDIILWRVDQSGHSMWSLLPRWRHFGRLRQHHIHQEVHEPTSAQLLVLKIHNFHHRSDAEWCIFIFGVCRWLWVGSFIHNKTNTSWFQQSSKFADDQRMWRTNLRVYFVCRIQVLTHEHYCDCNLHRSKKLFWNSWRNSNCR